MFIGFSKRLGGGFRIGSYFHIKSVQSKMGWNELAGLFILLGICASVKYPFILAIATVIGLGYGIYKIFQRRVIDRQETVVALYLKKHNFKKTSAFKKNAALREKIVENMGRVPVLATETYYGQNGHLYARSEWV